MCCSAWRFDGESALARAMSGDDDLLILDLGLPRRDGMSVLRDLRERGSHLPVVILTARDTVPDTVSGVRVDGRGVDLTARAEQFLRHPDQVLSRVWGLDFAPRARRRPHRDGAWPRLPVPPGVSG